MKIGKLEIRLNKKQEPVEERSLNFGLGFNGISGYKNTYAMRLAAVYCATNQISNSCALLPINITKYKGGKRVLAEHTISDVLSIHPNDYMNHFDLFKMMIESVILNGEAFCYIERDNNLNVKALHYIDPLNVQVLVKNNQMKYLVTGMNKAVDGVNMIHLYQHLDLTTHRGISTLTYANRTLKSSSEAEIHSSNFFKSGANLSGILKSTSPLNNKQKQEIRDSWSSAFSNNSGDVSVAVLPQGLEYQPISINPADSQLLESRQYDVIEIARFFNISPIKLFDLTNSSYATAEQTQLSYISDTIYPYVRMMEEEFNRKLFKPSEVGKYQVKFDFTDLMTTDKQSQASFYKTLMVNGIMSLNEVRERLSLPRIDEGDEHFIQLNMTTLENVVEGYNIKNKQDNNFKNVDVDNDIDMDEDNDKNKKDNK